MVVAEIVGPGFHVVFEASKLALMTLAGCFGR
jgi:hypothetical protein